MIFHKVRTFICCAWLYMYVECVNVEVGNVIDLFKNYGVLSKILPFQYDEEFVDTEFSQNLFKEREALNQYRVTKFESSKKPTWKIQLYKDFWHFISNFFEDYKIEFVENVRRSFVSTWNYKTFERFLGVPAIYLMHNYSFLLIKQEKRVTHYSIKLVNSTEYPAKLNKKLLTLTESMSTDDPATVFDLVAQFGSHFVNSFDTGDVIYQIFVHSDGVHECFNNSQRNMALAEIPHCVRKSIIYTGKIKTLSCIKDMEDILNSKYKDSQSPKHSNILLMKEDCKNSYLEDLCSLQNNTITGFNLTGINNFIQDKDKSNYVQEILDNQMKLRDLYV